MPNHDWTVRDDIIAYFLYKFGDKDLLYTIDTIGDRLGMGVQSLKARMANFQYLDTGQGLSNAAKQSGEVFEKLKDAPKDAYLDIVKEYLYPKTAPK